MIPVYTQKSLDKLTWPEIQKLHSSLGLKATAGARTRRHLQKNILTAQPQPVTEVEQIATPLTCATCPLARQIEDNRYCCGLTDAVVRGHWEGTSDCYKAVADAQPKTATAETLIAPEPIAPEEITIAQSEPVISVAEKLTGLSRHPFRYRHDLMKGRHSFTSSMFGCCECADCNKKRELPVAQQPRGSHQKMLDRFSQKKVEIPIALKSFPVTQFENQMDDEFKQDIVQRKTLSLFKIEPFHQSILPTEPEEIEAEIEIEGTIHWTQALASGVIVGKEGAKRSFYIRNGEIFIMLSPDFIAGESRHPNVRHKQIRDAINTGRAFNAKAFKDSADFEHNTEDCGNGRIMKGLDGRWWAWASRGITGHSFFSKVDALKYLEVWRVINLRK